MENVANVLSIFKLEYFTAFLLQNIYFSIRHHKEFLNKNIFQIRYKLYLIVSK